MEVYEAAAGDAAEMNRYVALRQPTVFDAAALGFEPAILMASSDALLKNFAQHSANVLIGSGLDAGQGRLTVAEIMQLAGTATGTAATGADTPFVSCSNGVAGDTGSLLRATNLDAVVAHYDAGLRPPNAAMLQREVDLVFGNSPGYAAPLQAELANRLLLVVTQGVLQVRLVPPDYAHLVAAQEADYAELQGGPRFVSPTDLWVAGTRGSGSREQVASPSGTLNVTLRPGQAIYVPPFWLYTYQLPEAGSSFLKLSYWTLANQLAVLPHMVARITERYSPRVKPRMLQQPSEAAPADVAAVAESPLVTEESCLAEAAAPGNLRGTATEEISA
jgi:hypothetical protein